MKRITQDVTIGLSERLLESVDAWARHLEKPRAEFVREIIGKHLKRVGAPPTQPESPQINILNIPDIISGR